MYFNGVYYLPVDGGYQVVEKPADKEVIAAPVAPAAPSVSQAPATEQTSTYEKIVIEGKTYYKKGSSYYKAAVDDKGEIVYEKVGEISK
jgi:hypothetical protein